MLMRWCSCFICMLRMFFGCMVRCFCFLICLSGCIFGGRLLVFGLLLCCGIFCC